MGCTHVLFTVLPCKVMMLVAHHHQKHGHRRMARGRAHLLLGSDSECAASSVSGLAGALLWLGLCNILSGCMLAQPFQYARSTLR